VRAGQSAQDARANAEAQRVSQLLSEYRDSLVELGLRNEIAVVAVRQVAQQPARDRRPYAESAVAVTRALPGAGAGAIAAAIASVHAEFPEVAAS
jgi:chemotaxis regulatin CheY-phosphate phosphatase CheZ